MKYTPISGTSYESGLTARLMYDTFSNIFKANFSTQEIEQELLKASTTLPIELWKKPKIRGELEEFVRSYLFSGLDEQLPGFQDNFVGDFAQQKRNLESYIGRLEQEYGSRQTAERRISEVFKTIRKRVGVMDASVSDLEHLEGDPLIKANAREAFRHISFNIYGSLDVGISQLGIKLENIVIIHTGQETRYTLTRIAGFAGYYTVYDCEVKRSLAQDKGVSAEDIAALVKKEAPLAVFLIDGSGELGVEALRKIREEHGKMPIYIVYESQQIQGTELGSIVNGHLILPINSEEFEKLLESHQS